MWEMRKISWHSYVAFYYLMDGRGNHIGVIRGDTRPGHGFTPYTNDMADPADFPTQSTLEEAQAMLVAHFAYKKLKGE